MTNNNRLLDIAVIIMFSKNIFIRIKMHIYLKILIIIQLWKKEQRRHLNG